MTPLQRVIALLYHDLTAHLAAIEAYSPQNKEEDEHRQSVIEAINTRLAALEAEWTDQGGIPPPPPPPPDDDF